ncbi:hypothetical protein Kisp01_64480 [Kineosporia sp. NBRC 101677]|uniref:glycosyltransferase family 9 protein n=1 Tax=Kineosporia sp. NBRC 101677 TaxID=3032197 RepID=UPI0024A33451|nr:hypothetical protein [Kineosporia sp. NBRC 101677]GLY19434.1 hypothetical protein Kisp01_64480 [Kineosporia sp. NBRC 101677]
MPENPESLSVAALTAGVPGPRVLWLHDTDRWYLGDFLRHAAWLGWLGAHLPGASIDLASHPAYLPLYRDDRFDAHLDVGDLDPAALQGYDLVVVPSSFPPADRPDPGVRRLLHTWDAGWALHARGRRIAGGTKNVLNYFRAAHPHALVAPEKGGEWDCEGTPFRFTRQERLRAAAVLSELVPGDRPVLIYNPSASNPFTRQTDVLKEVENCLGPRQHAAVLRQIVQALPGHDVLVAAPVKPGDQANAENLLAVAAATPGVHCLLDLPQLPEGGRWQESDPTTLRGFAALMAGSRICGSVGVGTGSNTHLAALTGTWSLSFERAADEAILDNWSRPETFQMGSFRWRNPSPLTAIHLMRWDRLGDAEFARAAQAALTHHQAWHLSRDQAFSALDLTPSAWLYHTDFRDEMAYLQHLSASRGADGEHLVRQLYRDSNLHKLARRTQVLTGRAGVA